MLLETDDPGRFSPGSEMRTDTGMRLVVRSVSPYRDKGLVVGFEGFDDRSAAERLRGSILAVDPSSRRDLAPGEFWSEDLLGLRVVSPTGKTLGTVTGVELGEAQDRLVITTTDHREVQVPFVDALVGDPVGGRLVVDAPPGLFE